MALLFVGTVLLAGELRSLVMQPFDSVNQTYNYQRGSYLILLPEGLNETFLTNENYGGNFVKFKKSQGFDVEVLIISSNLTAQQVKDTIVIPFYESNPMLEYVLLVGDVNGTFSIPTFTIPSYNEEDIDVTDYPYTFTDNAYEPHFFLGRWPIRTTADFLNIKSRSIQYVTMENIDDYSYLNKAMLVAGNYKTAEGEEVPPNQWPVTPVWTSLWLMEEWQDFGYTEIDTAFFHQYNWETGEYNPTIPNTWDDGVGIINYRGWGDGNGWHKPYFHKEELEGLNNGWNLPIVLSFVCNTGDFGNDYSGSGLSKCFGEVMVTAGSVINPKGAAAMVGPSDLDTDTRFNNVICGEMWDALLEQDAPELAQALHVGKQSLMYEFSGLSAPDGTVIDYFYHHIYSVIGDPSIPVRLLEPGVIVVDIQSTDLTSSFISTILTDQSDGTPLSGVVGALLDSSGNLIAKSVSNSEGQLIVDFDTDSVSDLTLYLNSAQYRQESMQFNYLSDDGGTYSNLVPVALDFDISLYDMGNIPDYVFAGDSNASFRAFLTNNSSEDIDINVEVVSLSDYMSVNQSASYMLSSFESAEMVGAFSIASNAVVGMVLPFKVTFTSSQHEIQDYYGQWIVGSGYNDYYTDTPSPQCEYGYKAYDNTDIDYEQAPVYNWIEINQIGTNLNLTDDSVINDVQIGFDFNYFGETYTSMTVCSNGWASFEPCPLSHFWNFSIPNPMGPSGMLAPFMDDLDDDDGNEPFNVYAYNDGNGRFIVQWDNVSNGEDDQNCPDCIKETFQMILYDSEVYPTVTGDGDIVFQYKEIHDIDQNGNYSTIGIESPNQDDGVQYLFSGNPGLGSYWEMSDSGYYENIAIKFATVELEQDTSDCITYDVNGDFVINVVDIISVVNVVLSIQDASNFPCSADVNGDSITNVIDVVALVNYILS
ncbi:MAG: hypothetical protein CMG66_03370 [Candidatus Marinimicrobia bacterium]|nr:hypothetical protein [Candidatus Neomarinimicrobiota bacterium]|tara:strand:- start:5173 stop:7959 length:2787 start_codon:yes stop_codon:yes gene_type:complete